MLLAGPYSCMQFSKPRLAGIAAAITAAAYGVYRFRTTDEDDPAPAEADEDAPAATA
jgi:hypothetical protein